MHLMTPNPRLRPQQVSHIKRKTAAYVKASEDLAVLGDYADADVVEQRRRAVQSTQKKLYNYLEKLSAAF